MEWGSKEQRPPHSNIRQQLQNLARGFGKVQYALEITITDVQTHNFNLPWAEGYVGT